MVWSLKGREAVWKILVKSNDNASRTIAGMWSVYEVYENKNLISS